MGLRQKTQAQLKAEQEVLELQRSYQNILVKESPVVQKILDDLRIFCRGDKSTFHADARIHAMLEGRREVFQHIMDQLNKPSQEIVDAMYERTRFPGGAK